MRLSFRTKMFIALVGLIVPTLAVVLLAVDQQTKQQVQSFTARTGERARVAFEDAESSNRGRLEGLGRRFAASPRATALLTEASAYGDVDTAFIAQQLVYELQVVGEDSALVAITDIEGKPIAAVEGDAGMHRPAEAVPAKLMTGMIERGDTSGFGYQLVKGRLYSVFVALVRLGPQPIGFFVMGRPIDQDMAQNIGRAVEGTVCFVAADRCVASNGSLSAAGLTESDMVGAAHGHIGQIRRGGRRFLIIADPLTGGTGSRVIARPLDDVLRPFDEISSLLLKIGIAALLLAPLFAIVLARSLAQPIRALVAATARIAHGDYSTRVPVTSNDELGALSSSFNDMTEGLQQRETFRGLLDKVISPEIADEMLRTEISLGGENKDVTVIFADIRGFTSFTENMEPQEVIRVLNEAMDRASAVVEREGGVVDKYMGDEIMAIFGAPVSHEDDAVRAARAAVGIRDAIADLSAERTARGERGLTIGIGINTGVAVAGNMGSERRLNYTVLGMSVNIAARLCSEARPQEILLAEDTCARIRHCSDVQPAGMRLLRGLTQPLATFTLRAVDCVIPEDAAVSTADGDTGTDSNIVTHNAAHTMSALLLAASCAFAPHLRAQQAPIASWSNNSGSLQASVSTRLEMTMYSPMGSPPWLIPDTVAFAAPRASLFGEAFAGKSLYATSELRLDRGERPEAGSMHLRVQQLFMRYTVGTALELQAGKFVSPFGAYPQRHGQSVDPFIRAPLPYDWPTMIAPGIAPQSNNGFLGWKDQPSVFRPVGVPPVWGVPYQVGGMAFGTHGILSYRLAVMNSAPSSTPEEWNSVRTLFDRPSYVASLGVQLTNDVRIGTSYDRGPFMHQRLDEGAYPAGHSSDTYLQTIYGVDATYAREHIEFHAEGFLDQWDVPNVFEYPTDYSGYIESRLKLSPGFYVAARAAYIDFNKIPIATATGTPSDLSIPWDYACSRFEVGAGYQINRAMSVRAEYQFMRAAAYNPRNDLLSLQFRIDP